MTSTHPRFGLVLAFLAVFWTAAVGFQIASPVQPNVEACPIDQFTAGLLWILSFVSLCMASLRSASRRRMLLWLGSCVALAGLAVDEVLGFHERTAELVGDDDHFKWVAWLGAGCALWVLHRMERPDRRGTVAILAGYAWHTIYLLIDLGDGEFYRIPRVSGRTLIWAEELAELTFLCCYLAAYATFLGRAFRAAAAGDARAPGADESSEATPTPGRRAA